jgi:hypothetical protein
LHRRKAGHGHGQHGQVAAQMARMQQGQAPPAAAMMAAASTHGW